MSSPCEGKPEGHVTSSRENNDRETAGFEPGDPPLLTGAHSRYLMPGRGNTRGGRLEEESARRGVGRRDRKAFRELLKPLISGTRAILVLLYRSQVGQAFLPALQRTGLEACPYLSRTRYTNRRIALIVSLPSPSL